MPIVQIAGKLVYFAHVPKCAGSAVERYLRSRFGPLGFLDNTYLQIPKSQRWTATSPQHIDIASFDRLLPSNFFAARFAVVRHPVDRLVSVFRFQRDLERKIPKKTVFQDWLEALPDQRTRRPFRYDNHVRPMVDFVPKDATVFRMEQGLWPMIRFLDDLAGDETAARRLERTNTYARRLAHMNRKAGPPPQVTDAVRRRIKALYAEDFERFGYDAEGTT